jgi:membrane-bound ClpP family serine protease
MTGGSLSNTAATGPLFYVTNSTGVITLKGVKVTAAGGVLIKAATGNWGNSGSNGGTVVFTADGETLAGDLVSDSSSSIAATLQNGTALTGKIESAALTLDATSVWNVTGDSQLTSLSDASGISGTTITNINGNGHTVYYDAGLSANSALDGKTYSLAGGGQLTPKS